MREICHFPPAECHPCPHIDVEEVLCWLGDPIYASSSFNESCLVNLVDYWYSIRLKAPICLLSCARNPRLVYQPASLWSTLQICTWQPHPNPRSSPSLTCAFGLDSVLVYTWNALDMSSDVLVCNPCLIHDATWDNKYDVFQKSIFILAHTVQDLVDHRATAG